jgi:uncharacterized protein (DUF2252 family)
MSTVETPPTDAPIRWAPDRDAPPETAPVADRVEYGRSLRTAVPRSAHADFAPGGDRDPVAILETSNADRAQELVPIRYGRMIQSPFTYLRGSPPVMAADLAALPTTKLEVQACGDCHLFNFGIFATPERNVVFGLNDFDETLRGPWEWDLKRLVTSIVVAARDVELGAAAASAAAEAAVRSYREHLWQFVNESPLGVWYDRIDATVELERAPDEKARRTRAGLLAKAQKRVGEQLYPKIVETSATGRRIVDQPPLVFHPSEENFDELVREFIELYRESLPEDRRVLFDRYKLDDVAVKVVGVGSVGTRCFVALYSTADGHPLFLQIKEALPSILEPYWRESPYENEGQRVVVGQRLMQPASDIFLGWGTGRAGRYFYVRQLRDMKLSVTLMRGEALQLRRYSEYCGWALARAHANTGDAAMIAGYLGRNDRFDRALATFAEAAADQNERDHATLLDAVKSGRVEALEEE